MLAVERGMTPDHVVELITTIITGCTSLGVAYLGYLGLRVRHRDRLDRRHAEATSDEQALDDQADDQP
jgi:hypothetical protein